MAGRARRLLTHPVASWRHLLDAHVRPALVARTRGVTLEGRLVLRGMPLLELCDDASIVLGDNVTLNSRGEGYHLNLFAPVKLMADRPGARIVIGANTRMSGTCVHAYARVTIGRNCLIAGNCQILDGSGHDLCFPNVEERLHTRGGARPITIEDDVWIGTGSIVLPGVTIGCGSVVSAGSVVRTDLPPFVLAAGNPAVVIRDYSGTRGEPRRA